MRTLVMDVPISPTPLHPAEALRQQLGRPLRVLRFAPALEGAFNEEMRAAQYHSTLFTLIAVTVVWLLYAGLDVWRLHSLQGSGHEMEFVWGSIVLRGWVLVCLAAALVMVLGKQRYSVQTHARCIGLTVLACSMAILVSSYTLRNLGMKESSIVMLLTVVIALYPLGVRLRWMAPMALVLCLLTTVGGVGILRSDLPKDEHWVLSAMMWLTLVFSVVTAYFRERALREQFVLRQLLDWEASHDPLTGLANRRMFREHFQRCMQLARREQSALFLAIMDVDHFKLYNDRYGHQAGDEVLRQLAVLLQSYARRPMDLAVRLGGEEFALVAMGDDVNSLRKRMLGLMQALQDLGLQHEGSPTAPYVTISMGIAQLRDGDTLDSLLQWADSLLYQAKAQGRNRMCDDPLLPRPASPAAAAD